MSGEGLSAEIELTYSTCSSVSEVRPFDFDGPLRCLLAAPHLGYRHYAAVPFRPDRFWTWDDKHPESPCSSVDCPGDGRYGPPGKGHYGGCTSRLRLPLTGCQTCGWVGEHDPKSVACHVPTKSSGGVVDLLGALQRSVDAAKSDRVNRPAPTTGREADDA